MGNHRSQMSDITADELKEYLKDFNKFDKDGSGSLEKPEIFKALEELLGHTPDEGAFEEFMQEADTDQNGKIDFKEFMCVVLSDSEWTVEGEEYGAQKKKKDQSEREEAQEEQEHVEAEEEQEDDEAEHDDAYWEKKQLQDDEAFEAEERKRDEDKEEEERKQEEADEAEERKREEDEEAEERESEAAEAKRYQDQVQDTKRIKAKHKEDKAAGAKRQEEHNEMLAAMLAASDEARPDGESAVDYRARREVVMTQASNIRYAEEAKELEEWNQAEAAARKAEVAEATEAGRAHA